MTDAWRSMLLGPSALWIVAVAAGALTGLRTPSGSERDRNALVTLFLIGVAAQCAHLLEEYLTGFYTHWPEFVGLTPWTPQFFVSFNVVWIAFWCAGAAGILLGYRLAFVPLWFFALGMIGNAVWHPLLALATGAYFPGLWTSPVVGITGIFLVRRLLAFTRSE